MLSDCSHDDGDEYICRSKEPALCSSLSPLQSVMVRGSAGEQVKRKKKKMTGVEEGTSCTLKLVLLLAFPHP